MTYYLDPDVRKIQSPILLCIDDKEIEFANGQALSQKSFDKRYVIQSISAMKNQIVIVLEEGIMSPNPEGLNHSDMGIAD